MPMAPDCSGLLSPFESRRATVLERRKRSGGAPCKTVQAYLATHLRRSHELCAHARQVNFSDTHFSSVKVGF